MRPLFLKLRRRATLWGAQAGRPELVDLLVLGLVIAGAWLMALHQGGARAQGPLLGARCLLAAAVLHGVSLATRQEGGARMIRGALLFLPIPCWLAADALLLAPDTGEGLRVATWAILGAGAAWMAAHHARALWSQALALVLLVGPASMLASGGFDEAGGQVRAMLGLSPDASYAPDFASALGSPGSCAVILALTLVPALATAQHSRLRLWMRAIAAYFALLLAIGLAQTHHGWGLLAAAAGAGFSTWALRRKSGGFWEFRWVALLLALAYLVGDLDHGVMRKAADGSHPMARATLAALAEDPILGGGAGSFGLAFEKVRPVTWQTDPAGSGSLLLTTAAEHGILGLLAMGLPLAALLFLVGRSGLERPDLPPSANSVQYHRAQLRRTLVAGGAGGLIAATLLLVIDHPGGQPGILALVGIAAGVLIRATGATSDARVTWPEAARPVLSVLCIGLPLAAAPLLLAPLSAREVAERSLERLVKLSPEGIEGAKLLDAAGENQLRLAEARLRRSLELNPADAMTRAWLAQDLALQHRQRPAEGALWLEGVAQARRATADAPRLPFPRLVLGSLLMGSLDPREREEGLGWIRSAQALAPHDRAAVLRLAQALGQSGADVDNLRPVLELAAKVAPGRPEVTQRLSLLPAAKEGGSR